MCDAFIRIEEVHGTTYVLPKKVIISGHAAYIYHDGENHHAIYEPEQIIALREIMDRRTLEQDRIPKPKES